MSGGWFLTKRGMNFTRGLVVAVSTGSFGAYLGLHTLFMDNYRQILQFYSSGLEKQLSSELRELVGQVLQKTGLTEKERNSVGFFVTSGFEPIHIGTTQTRTGCLVGLPNHFHYRKHDQVEKSAIKLLNNVPVRWASPAGQDLLDSLVLSTAAEKFATAREIHYCTTSYVYARSLAASFCVTGSYLLGNGLARRFDFYRLPFRLRTILYCLCGAIGLCTFLTSIEAMDQYWDRYSDRVAALTSPEYLEGGIEFYYQCLKKNVALRILLEEMGEKYFTCHGNRKTWIFSGGLPLTVHLDYLKKLKREEAQSLES